MIEIHMDYQDIADQTTALKEELATERKLKSNAEQALTTLRVEMTTLREEIATVREELRLFRETMATEREAWATERQAWATERDALREALATERQLRHDAEKQRRENENRRNQGLEAIVNQQKGKPDIVTSITLEEFFSYILHTYYSL